MSEDLQLDQRLALAVVQLERDAAVRSPRGVRARGDQRRRRHAVAMTVTPVAVLAIVGGVALTVRPSGGSATPGVTAGAASSTATSTGAPAPVSPEPTAPVVVVDLAEHTMTVRDARGTTIKTLSMSAGSARRPTPRGTFTVAARSPTKMTVSSTVGIHDDIYELRVDWYVDLGPGAPAFYAAPWRQVSMGKENVSHGDITLGAADAKWLYDHLAVGDKIEVAGG